MRRAPLTLSLLLIASVGYAAVCSSVTQNGITWTFSDNVTCGQFVTGDWWVVAPVTIASKSPAWTGADHGSMLDPVPNSYNQGYHDNVVYYTPYDNSLRVSFPVTISSGIKSLVSTITDPDYTGTGTPRSFVRAAAVLTVVDNAPSATAFRPPFVSGPKIIHDSANINYSLVPSYTAPASALDLTGYGNMPTLNYGAKTFGEENWMPSNDWGGQSYPPYAVAHYVPQMMLMSMLDTPNRVSYINKIVQIGIDDYAKVSQMDYAWMASGGYGTSHLATIIYAGRLLDNSTMTSVERHSTEYPLMYRFSELGYTYTNSQGNPMFGSDDCLAGATPYPPTGCSNNMCRPLDGLTFPEASWGGCSGDYRYLVSANYAAQALTLRMLEPTLGTMTAFNHQPFFDYTDYWVAHPKTAAGADATTDFAKDAALGGTGNGFMTYMWDTYRGAIPDPDPSAIVSPAVLRGSLRGWFR